MNNRISKITAFAVLIILGSVAANADPVEWKVVDGGNGHFYELVLVPGITWPAARDAANASSESNLVTITSAAENQFIVNNFDLTGQNYWLGGFQTPGSSGVNIGWQWVTGEPWSYTNWAGGEPNDSGGASGEDGSEDALAHAGFGGTATVGKWNDAPTFYDYGLMAGYIVESNPGEAVVEVGEDVLIFNQADVPGSPNPWTAGYQEVITAGSVSIDCCRVLDVREGAGKGKKYGNYQPGSFDLGDAIADTDTNPSCADMPYVASNTAVMRPWQRGVPKDRGLVSVPPDPNFALTRDNDLGVCVIRSEAESNGVIFSRDEARNVLGYSLNCEETDIQYRPYTAGVALDPLEIDAPFLTRWSADCDGSRSAKRSSENLMVLNMRHYTDHNATKPYLSRLASALLDSIEEEKSGPSACVDNSEFFLDNLKDLVQTAKQNFAKKGNPTTAVESLDHATRLALLIPGLIPVPADNPYEDFSGDLCPGNPKGLFVGRLMALKFATCSEWLQKNPGDNAKSPAACKISGDDAVPSDIFAEMPTLPPPPAPLP